MNISKMKAESWHGSLDKLRNGEIDLLCTVHYTRDRAQEFLFSSIPLGYETSLLYSMPDSSISYQDFDAMQGCKIGLLRESYSAQEFESYAAQKGVLFESVYYERENLMMTALEIGAIDMMVVGSRCHCNNKGLRVFRTFIIGKKSRLWSVYLNASFYVWNRSFKMDAIVSV